MIQSCQSKHVLKFVIIIVDDASSTFVYPRSKMDLSSDFFRLDALAVPGNLHEAENGY